MHRDIHMYLLLQYAICTSEMLCTGIYVCITHYSRQYVHERCYAQGYTHTYVPLTTVGNMYRRDVLCRLVYTCIKMCYVKYLSGEQYIVSDSSNA